MTDEELIARLLYLSRVTRDYDQEDMISADYADMPVATKKAADRIEALTAKLAKAKAGLREIAGECGCFIARTTLAEIKGESHE